MTSKKPIFIVGPCVVEDFQIMRHIAETIKNISCEYNVTIYYKSSFDKANRTSIHSYRGPGIEKGLDVLKRIKEEYNLPIITDIHEPFQAEMVAKVVDIIQIPALLCRQTDLIVAAACTGKIVNLKKGQYMSGEDMKYPIDKARVSGAEYVYVTERGNMFGYNDIVVDFRNITVFASAKILIRKQFTTEMNFTCDKDNCFCLCKDINSKAIHNDAESVCLVMELFLPLQSYDNNTAYFIFNKENIAEMFIGYALMLFEGGIAPDVTDEALNAYKKAFTEAFDYYSVEFIINRAK